MTKRIKVEIYDGDAWLSRTDVALDPSIPISDAARRQILTELAEAMLMIAEAPRIEVAGSAEAAVGRRS